MDLRQFGGTPGADLPWTGDQAVASVKDIGDKLVMTRIRPANSS